MCGAIHARGFGFWVKVRIYYAAETACVASGRHTLHNRPSEKTKPVFSDGFARHVKSYAGCVAQATHVFPPFKRKAV
ncbi:hypothetical protein HMPREF9123_2181 [Neisseria bacilliformis ATCC BAA-1200]|uniref:Uncharacterized protein n=1 Tax=Neisseria bacilliformis ATCC BAA-1200 TaxID=888742 RepID=F2BEM4_9NEIS|nr:hypothetical protein HMPREF9123_2181 [Neisseria bacilliformis ATCC BAA-1200]